MHALAESGRFDRGLKFRPLTLPDRFIEQDSPARMYASAGLDAAGIAATALTALGEGAAVEAEAPAAGRS